MLQFYPYSTENSGLQVKILSFGFFRVQKSACESLQFTELPDAATQPRVRHPQYTRYISAVHPPYDRCMSEYPAVTPGIGKVYSGYQAGNREMATAIAENARSLQKQGLP
jgi:hypothetical protein